MHYKLNDPLLATNGRSGTPSAKIGIEIRNLSMPIWLTNIDHAVAPAQRLPLRRRPSHAEIAVNGSEFLIRKWTVFRSAMRRDFDGPIDNQDGGLAE